MNQHFEVILETPYGTHTLECRSDQYIWNAALQGGVRLPSICHQGRCLTCAGKLISGSVDQADADSYLAEDSREGFVLLCTARPRTNLHIRTHQEWEMRAHRTACGLPAPYA